MAVKIGKGEEKGDHNFGQEIVSHSFYAFRLGNCFISVFKCTILSLSMSTAIDVRVFICVQNGVKKDNHKMGERDLKGMARKMMKKVE